MYELFVITCILSLLILFALGAYQKSTNAICLSTKRLDGKTVIVTGGTSGIGLEIATDLARRGARVIVACPFDEEGTNARDVIVKKTDNSNVIYMHLDQSSLKSVRQFVTNILKNENRLDILVNNAGIGVPKACLTSDGMHFVMQVNYFGAALLTILLLPLLKKTGRPGRPSRILMTSSVTHFIAPIDVDKLNYLDHWLTFSVYSKSKFCVAEFTRLLAPKLKGFDVTINTVDPGLVGTRIYESGHKFFGFIFKYLLQLLYKTPWQGAQTALHVSLDDEAGKLSGKYFLNCKVIKYARTIDQEAAGKLWETSLRLVKLTEEELACCFK